MSAKERRVHLEQAIAEGGMIMTARGKLTREVPSSSTLARTPEERRAAKEDLERRALALQQEARRMEDDEDDVFVDRWSGERVQQREGTFGERALQDEGGERTFRNEGEGNLSPLGDSSQGGAQQGGSGDAELSTLPYAELRKRAKEAGVANYHSMKTDELIAAIQEKL
jgi:hypothetical protein